VPPGCGKDFLIVVPGQTRSRGASGRARKRKADDQARIATPTEAIRDGADYLVIRRTHHGCSRDPEPPREPILG